MTVRMITRSGHRPIIVVQNHDQRDFSGNMGGTQLMTACSRADLNIDHNRNDENRIVESFEDSGFPALGPNYDRQSHTTHNTCPTFWLRCWTELPMLLCKT